MSKFTYIQEKDFKEDILWNTDVLHDAVDWIKGNLSPDDVFDYEEMEDWALENNFKHDDGRDEDED